MTLSMFFYTPAPSPFLFLDRDGTLLVEPEDDWRIQSFDKLRFQPGVISALARIADELPFVLVMVSNQDGLGSESFSEEGFWAVQRFVVQTLADEGIRFEGVHIDRSFAHEGKATRKPGTAMLRGYDYDPRRSFVVGDSPCDMQLAQNLGCGAILYEGVPTPHAATELPQTLALRTHSWQRIYEFLRGQNAG